MRIFKVGEETFNRYISEVEARIIQTPLTIDKEVHHILREVRQKGDKALLHFTKRFDGVDIKAIELQVSKDEIRESYKKVPKDSIKTLERAVKRIRKFHQLSKRRWNIKWLEKGIRIEQIVRPLERVGIYIPGGKASYPSTVLMAAIPAKVAGVSEIIITTPPKKEGMNHAVLVAADLANVDRIYRVGGVQAIGALAYGTESIPRVDKIVGPGNRYVAQAKRFVYGAVDIDMIAGPSEIVIISDGEIAPSSIAADLISQAEHDEMALPILITPSEKFAKKVKREIEKQLLFLKRNKIARVSLSKRGALLIVRDLTQAIELANRIAPEHLELCVKEPTSMMKDVKNAGAVFLGNFTPEVIGDYIAGPNHILPTGGTARFFSALGIEDFIKKINFIRFQKEALRRFEKDVREFTKWEGLEGHYQSIRMRIKRL